MTTDEQRIFVCEKLFGWKPPDQIVEGYSFQDWVDDLPFLTLDWLHECWMKLMPEQKLNYINHLLALVLTDEYFPVYSTMIALEDATTEQRLTALVQALKQSPPVSRGEQS